MKNNKKILIIVCMTLIVAIISIILMTKNRNFSKDFNKITSFEYHLGNNSSFILVTGNKSNDLFDIKVEELISVNENRNIKLLTITSEELKELLNKTSQEDCKKHTYQYQCGEREDCSSSSFKINFGDEEKAICYEINNEISTYFNNLSKPSIDENISGVDWTNLAITMNGIQYKYPYKISEFLSNGWTPKSTTDQAELNKLVGEIDEETIKYYESIGVSKENITLGYKSAMLTQKGVDIFVYADNTVTDIKVSDANVVSLVMNEPTNADKNYFSFYGVNFGDNKEKIESLFGNKNYEVTSDETNYNYSYSKKLKNNLIIQIEFRINIEKNKLDKITFNFYQN